MQDIKTDQVLDASGLNCPLPLLKAKLALSQMDEGQILKVIATDSGSCRDIPAFLQQVDHDLMQQTEQDKHYNFWIQVHHRR